MSLMQFNDDIMPFTFADVLILRYLVGMADAVQTVKDFEQINATSQLNWSFKSQIIKFIKRFFKDPYRVEDTRWIKRLVKNHGINTKRKLPIVRTQFCRITIEK